MGGISYVLNKMIGRKRKQANSNSSTDRPLPYQSQCGQDRFVHERFFQDYPKGVFVDIGAYDGITCSNTHFFEHQLGWRGICVEPQQQLFARLTMERKCTCIRGCVSSEAGVGLFLEIDGLNMEAGLVKEYDPRHMKHIEAVIQRQQSSTNLIEVPCFRLDLLLEETTFNGLIT